MAGHCGRIQVTIHQDGSLSVRDDGRGIPVDPEPSTGLPAVEVVMTRLHAGGKFDADTYKYSAGLHGVGVSVVNALATWLRVEVRRNGTIHQQSYRRGERTGPLETIGRTAAEDTGTLVHFLPDPTIFEETTEFDFHQIAHRVRGTGVSGAGGRDRAGGRARRPELRLSLRGWNLRVRGAPEPQREPDPFLGHQLRGGIPGSRRTAARPPARTRAKLRFSGTAATGRRSIPS